MSREVVTLAKKTKGEYSYNEFAADSADQRISR